MDPENTLHTSSDSNTENEEYVYEFKNTQGELIKAFLPKFAIDMETMKQIKFMSENSILRNVRIMPDCHRGHGCCVGFTAYIEDKIFPRYVGVDIGCGISMAPLNIKLKRKKIPKIEELIREVIPMGTGPKGKNKSNQMRECDWQWLVEKNNADLAGLVDKMSEQYPEYVFPESLNREYIESMLIRIKCNHKNDIKSVGTLGGGNHYVEVNGEVDGANFITVHSGSRIIGKKICVHHENIIQASRKFDWEKYNVEKKKIDRKCKVSKKAKNMKDKIFEQLQRERHTKWLEGHEMLDYLVDMIVGQNLASLNRAIMIRNVLEVVHGDFDINSIIETRHNYIDFNRFIMRKGAISAETGEKCIISLNMRDGILLCEGKGESDWNYSGPHGCGRIKDRAQASRLNMRDFEKDMRDVYSTCVNKKTLDESPRAYRDVELLKKCLTGNIVVQQQLRPIINCKGFD